MAYEKDGNIEKAISNYQEFLTVSNNFNLKQEIRTKLEELKNKIEGTAPEKKPEVTKENPAETTTTADNNKGTNKEEKQEETDEEIEVEFTE